MRTMRVKGRKTKTRRFFQVDHFCELGRLSPGICTTGKPSPPLRILSLLKIPGP